MSPKHTHRADGLRRAAALALCLLLLGITLGAAGEKVLYRALTTVEFHLRMQPNSDDWIVPVPKGSWVQVLQYGKNWCKIRYNGWGGYCRTRWLREYISQDPLHAPVPGFTACTGYVRLSQSTAITGEGFTGLEAQKGALIAVYGTKGKNYRLPVWRAVSTIPASAGTFVAFTPWKTARPGDIIAGFTTFYNDRTGYPLNQERQYNIKKACKLLNGTVIQKSKTFSYNQTCGPYSLAFGYKVAPIIGAPGKGPGGGVCQLSTTLYNALLAVPIQITQWSVHRASGVSYIPVSFDACVGRYSDLCFQNTLPYAVQLVAKPQNGALTVLIKRAK